jgi:poly[(R)-3-hydroxyalkanoate] polymerase subunit PhaC
MHAEYLRRLYLGNDLAEGRYRVAGRPVALTDIRVPIFCIGTAGDHVAPWRSVYKLHLLTDSEITFLLAGGGHNTGIVNEPGGRNRGYQVLTRAYDGKYIGPEAFLAEAARHDGSWWPEWQGWLARHSGERVPPPRLGSPDNGYPPLGDAPGNYVLEH